MEIVEKEKFFETLSDLKPEEKESKYKEYIDSLYDGYSGSKKEIDKLKESVQFHEKEKKDIIEARDKAKQEKRDLEKKLSSGADNSGLIEEKQKEIDELSSKLNELNGSLENEKKVADAYREYESKKRDTIKESLGDKYKDYMGSLSLKDFEELAKDLNQVKPAPNGDGGPNGDRRNVTLNEAERKRAIEMFPGREKERAFEAYAKIKKEK